MSNLLFTPIESKIHKGWFEIPGYNQYLANEKGQILSKKTRNYTYGGNAGRYLKVAVFRDNEPRVSLRYVHVLVASAFYGIPDGVNMVVKHKDNNRRNNKKSNLEWGTQSSNIKQIYEDGLKYSKQYAHLYPDRFASRLGKMESLVDSDLGESVLLEW
ncbi:MAG: HNH endonuclease [Gammaproteobacteria bacterium]|nr:HNH endonuclease [Acholeplasmataceae bacterium]MCK9529146.1 HNH endonuclease [Gammaproteobacteria bacterium]